MELPVFYQQWLQYQSPVGWRVVQGFYCPRMLNLGVIYHNSRGNHFLHMFFQYLQMGLQDVVRTIVINHHILGYSTYSQSQMD